MIELLWSERFSKSPSQKVKGDVDWSGWRYLWKSRECRRIWQLSETSWI